MFGPFLLECLEDPFQRLVRDHEPGQDPLVQAQVPEEAPEEAVDDGFEVHPGIRVLEDPSKSPDSGREVPREHPLERGGDAVREDVAERGAVTQQAVECRVHLPLNAPPKGVAVHIAPGPLRYESGEVVLTGRRQEFTRRSGGDPVPHAPERFGRYLLETGRFHPAEELSGKERSHLVEQAVCRVRRRFREALAQWPPFSVQQFRQESFQPPVEGVAEFAVREDRRKVLVGQEPLPHGPARRLGEAPLVLGDRAVEEAKPATTQPRRFMRMEEHPDCEGVGEPTGERAESDREQRPEEFGGHGATAGRREPGGLPAEARL